jgi:hypothetical protein
MNKLLVLASALLLAITLTSCKSFGSVWSVQVENRVDFLGDVPVRICTGELTATVVVGTQVNVTVAAGPGDAMIEEARPAGGWRAGDPLVLEATCTDEDGREVGYARVEGRVSPPQYTTNPGSTSVYPPADSGGGPLYPTCLTPTVQRGQPPCIVERLMIPN